MEAKDVKEKGQAPVTALFRSGACFSVVSHILYIRFLKLYIYNMCACVACVFVGPPKIGKNGRMTSKPLVPHGSTLMTIGFYFHSDYGV